MAFLLGHGFLISLSKSKVVCYHCTRPMMFEEFENQWGKDHNGFIRKKCPGCKRFIGITQSLPGDFISYHL